MRPLTAALAILLAAATLAPVATPAAAQSMTIARIKAATPQCRDHPDYPFVGRVVGIVGSSPARGASFVGCFPTLAECERWRGPVSGVINGRLTLNSCEPRR